MIKKNAKMNITLDIEFYEFLKLIAYREHLKPSTFVKKFLMDNLVKDNLRTNDVQYDKVK